jgi:LPS-assembly lipoprotein
MSWRELAGLRGIVVRVAGIVAAGALVSGCFQPLYGNYSLAGNSSVAAAMASVDVNQIAAPSGTPESRVAVELRNQLLFNLTGGSGGAPPAYRLTVRMSTSRTSVIVDVTTGLPDVENYGITASYDLIDAKSGKVVVNSQAFARVSYDIPGQEQRFARARGLRDAENRAAKEIADNIRARLASYFVAGT